MKNILFIFVLLFSFAGFAAAQEEADAPPHQLEQKQRRPNLLRELNLTPEQMQQIRQINAENKEKLGEAQMRVRQAMRNLDQAVYADVLDEEAVKMRMRELQEAQTEVTRLRAATEIAVRKLLSPEQLARFRELRQQFNQIRQNRQNQRFERRNQRKQGFPDRRVNKQQPPPNQ